MSMKDPGYTRGRRLSDQSFPKYTRKCKKWIERAGHHNFSEIILIYLCQIWWICQKILIAKNSKLYFTSRCSNLHIWYLKGLGFRLNFQRRYPGT